VKGRATRQRAAVAAALDEVDEFRSAQELHDMLKHKGDSVGLTTVYRTLQSLADAGEVDVLRTSDGESVYRRCSTGDHHHHLVCRTCGKAVEVEGPAVEKWADAIAAEHGYVKRGPHDRDLRHLRGVRRGQRTPRPPSPRPALQARLPVRAPPSNTGRAEWRRASRTRCADPPGRAAARPSP
jgi:Fur family ferric uptake transcriptional regulator